MLRQYAEAICNLLDPDGKLFGKRVVANSGVSGSDSSAAADLIKRLDAQVDATLQRLSGLQGSKSSGLYICSEL